MKIKATALILAVTALAAALPCAAADEYINAALNQQMSASSYAAGHMPGMANDDINDNEEYTYWISAADDGGAWCGVDLGTAQMISAVEIEARCGDVPEEERSNFRIIASDSADFGEYEVLAEVSAAYTGGQRFDVGTTERFRYVRAQKTDGKRFSIAELRVFVDKNSVLQGDKVDSTSGRMVYNTQGITTTPADVSGKPYEKQVMLLYALGVIAGYENGLFLPEGNMTRAEFVTCIAKMKAAGYNAEGESFDDVPADYWAFDSVEYAYENGYIHGVTETEFAPDEYITTEQAAAILINVMGYGELLPRYGAYPDNVIRLASALKLFDGTARGFSGPICRADIACMIYNALMCSDKEYIFSGDGGFKITGEKSVLNSMLDVYKDTGRLDAVGTTSLTDERYSAPENTVSINGTKYFCDADVSELLGQTVDFFYREDDDARYNTIVIITEKPQKNRVTDVDANELIGFEKNAVSYYTDAAHGKTKKINISSAVDVVYNGNALRSYTPETLLPKDGGARFIDNDNDGRYDVIIIEKNDIYAVNWVNTKSRELYFKNSAAVLKCGDDTETVIRCNGEELALEDIRENDILSVAESIGSDNKKIKITVSRESVDGTVEKIDAEENTLTVDGGDYKCIYGLALTAFGIGSNGTFYLDAKKRIAYFDQIYKKESRYGYLYSARYSAVDEELALKIFTDTGEFVRLVCSEKFKVDGYRSSAEETIAQLGNTGNAGTVRQLIKYSVNSKNEVTYIDTVARGADETKENLTLSFVSGSLSYSETGVVGMQFAAGDDLVIFAIPDNPEREEDYRISSTAEFEQSQAYSFKAYDADDYRITKCWVINETSKVKEDSALAIVGKIITTVNEDDDVRSAMSCIYKGEIVTLTEKDGGLISAQGLKKGDICAVEVNNRREITSIEKRFYPGTRPDGAADYVLSPEHPQTINGAYNGKFSGYGTVMFKKQGKILVKFDTDTPYSSLMFDCEKEDKAMIYIYDTDEDEIRVGTSDDIADAKTVGDARASRVFFRIHNYDVCEIIVVR